MLLVIYRYYIQIVDYLFIFCGAQNINMLDSSED